MKTFTVLEDGEVINEFETLAECRDFIDRDIAFVYGNNPGTELSYSDYVIEITEAFNAEELLKLLKNST